MPRLGLRSAKKTAKSSWEDGPTRLKALLTAEEVVLSAELAELLRWRNVTWSRIPHLLREMTLPFLTLKDILRLDSAVLEKGEGKESERDHLIKAYKGLRSPGFDDWVFKDTNDFEGLHWARKRGIDLQNLKLEYEGKRDADEVLRSLVYSLHTEDFVTYFAMRSNAKDTVNGGALRHASEKGYSKVVQCILERGTEKLNTSHFCSTPLLLAIEYGHPDVVKVLMDFNADVNIADEDNKSPLLCACTGKWSYPPNLEIVKILLAANADVNKRDRYGYTPLLAIIEDCEGNTPDSNRYQNQLDLIEVLVAAKADVNMGNQYGDTPLLVATRYGSLEIVKILLTANAEVDKGNFHGRTPLNSVSRGQLQDPRQLEILKTLLAAGADVNKADCRPALSAPCWQGDVDMVKILLAAGADANAIDDHGLYDMTLLSIASSEGHVEIVKILLAAGAEVNKQDRLKCNGGLTPLSSACKKGQIEVVKTLLAAKADVNKADIHGMTPLHWASYYGNLEVVKALLGAEADVNKADNDGRTPLHLSSHKGHLEVVEALLAAKADVNKASSRGRTPLHDASSMKWSDERLQWEWERSKTHMVARARVMETLLAAEADVDKADSDGKTPLHQASAWGYLRLVNMLLASNADVYKSTADGETPLDVALSNKHSKVATVLRKAM